MASEHVEHIAQTTAQYTTYAGAGGGIIGYLMSINWLGLIGATAAVVGLGVSWYYQHKRDKREQAEHEARMKGGL